MNTQELTQLTEAVKAGKRKDAQSITAAALEQGTPAQQILDALMVGMDDVGRRFKANEIFVPEVLVAARAMKTAMEILEPVLVASGIQPTHKVVIGTVEGDLHDIGKNLVVMMLRGANFQVIDLGTNVSAQAFADAVNEHGAQVVGLSCLLTTTMPAMRNTAAKLRADGLPVKIMVGGAPITEAFAREIGADGYSADAASAVDLARSLAGVGV